MGQRGRKKGANGEQSKRLLLDIAADEFANNGYYNTKISTIVKRASLTQPTFYLYFESKETIFQELVSMFRVRLFDLIKKSRLESGIEFSSLSERITEKLTAILNFFVENPNLTTIGFFLASEAAEIKEQMAALIAENLKSEQKDGYFRSDIDTDIVSESLIGMMERFTVTKLFKGLQEPEELSKKIVHLLLYGMVFNHENG